MLKIIVPKSEIYIESTNEFASLKKDTPLQLEHSLVSLSKWEAKWHKAYLSRENKTIDEVIDYIRCMTITPNVDPEVYKFLTQKNVNDVVEYIEDPMTATTFHNELGKGGSGEIPTAEIIYYAMIASNIPFECQKWHLNRLLTLIRVCSIKNQPPKKMSQREIMSRNNRLNAARKKRLNTKG